jgi:hypothetical protein
MKSAAPMPPEAKTPMDSIYAGGAEITADFSRRSTAFAAALMPMASCPYKDEILTRSDA